MKTAGAESRKKTWETQGSRAVFLPESFQKDSPVCYIQGSDQLMIGTVQEHLSTLTSTTDAGIPSHH